MEYSAQIMAPPENTLYALGGDCKVTFLNIHYRPLGDPIEVKENQEFQVLPETRHFALEYNNNESFHLGVKIIPETLWPQNEIKQGTLNEEDIPEQCLRGEHLGMLLRTVRQLKDGTTIGCCTVCMQVTDEQPSVIPSIIQPPRYKYVF
jgi:hypothetical protein